MTSRERLLRTIRGEVTDRVPVTLFIQDHGHFIHQLHPEVDPLDYEQLTCKVIDYQRSLGCDVFARMIFDLYHPLGICLGGVDDGHETECWKVKTNITEEGNNLVRSSVIATPDGELSQVFVRTALNRGTCVYCCTKKPIATETDLDIAIQYEPKMSVDYGEMVKKKIRRIKEYLGDDGIIGTWVSGGPFNNASMIIEHTQLYMLFMSEPDFFDKLMQFTINRTLDYTSAFIDAGADVMLVGHWIEMRSVMGASKALEELASLMPAAAHRVGADGSLEDVPLEQLQVKDRVLVRPGEKIPADGLVVKLFAAEPDVRVQAEPMALSGLSERIGSGEVRPFTMPMVTGKKHR